jgi:tetratricopeptide (TPR) repeat protein
MHDPTSACLSLAENKASAGMYNEAIRFLREFGITEQDRPSLSTSPLLLRPTLGVKGKTSTSPLIFYHLAYYAGKLGKSGEAIRYAQLAAQMSPDYCFPSLLESDKALRYAQKINPQDARAPYYLGNLLYDKKRYHEAIEQWEWSLTLSAGEIVDSGSGQKNYRAILQRNLGMAYFNIEKNPHKALLSYQAACQLNPNDARLFFELDQLQKFLGTAPEERLAQIESRLELAGQRDDLSLERISLYNLRGDYDKALQLLDERTFRPWEGGEGRVSQAYIFAHLQRGARLLQTGQAQAALADFQAALSFPANLGEGRHAIWLPEADIFYFLGCAYQALGDTSAAVHYFEKCVAENKPHPEMLYYKGLALQKLGRPEEAGQKFTSLREIGAQRLASVDFQTFQTSVPTLTVLNDDPSSYIQKDGHFWLGLGWMGAGKMGEAAEEFTRTLQIDPCHASAKIYLERIQAGKGNLA